MGFGNAGFAPTPEDIQASVEQFGVETSEQHGTDTDILVFNMSSSVIVGVNEDAGGSHTVATSVEVEVV